MPKHIIRPTRRQHIIMVALPAIIGIALAYGYGVSITTHAHDMNRMVQTGE